jgi:1-acyl-sn-glycerol-3-phosphate acyltransferase
MIRIAFVAVGFSLATLVLLPLQYLAVMLDWPLKRAIPTFFHRMMGRLFGLRIHVSGERSKEAPLLLVANHNSWLDITVISALGPAVFVAKSEIAAWPLFGLFAKLQRSIFVDRNRRHKTPETTATMARRLAEGDPVVLFGEGTSSDGNRVLPFRTALLGAAHEVMTLTGGDRVMLQPVAIAYTSLLGLPLGRQHRPLVAWYGGFNLLPHLVNIARLGGVDVAVTFAPALPFQIGSDRKRIAADLETAVRRYTVAALRGRPDARPGAA